MTAACSKVTSSGNRKSMAFGCFTFTVRANAPSLAGEIPMALGKASMHRENCPFRQKGHTPHSGMGLMATRSPARHSVTPFPVSATVPTASCPITVPRGIMIPFRYPWTSEPQIPHRATSTNTSPGSATGLGRSWNSSFCNPENTGTFMGSPLRTP